MNDKTEPDDMTDRIIAQLDIDAAHIPPSMAFRLRNGRLKALELKEGPSFLGFPRWITLSGLTTAVILVIAVSLWIRAPKTAIDTMHPEDLEVINAPDQIELYRDLDFYRWLAGGEDGR